MNKKKNENQFKYKSKKIYHKIVFIFVEGYPNKRKKFSNKKRDVLKF